MQSSFSTHVITLNKLNSTQAVAIPYQNKNHLRILFLPLPSLFHTAAKQLEATWSDIFSETLSSFVSLDLYYSHNDIKHVAFSENNTIHFVGS